MPGFSDKPCLCIVTTSLPELPEPEQVPEPVPVLLPSQEPSQEPEPEPLQVPARARASSPLALRNPRTRKKRRAKGRVPVRVPSSLVVSPPFTFLPLRAVVLKGRFLLYRRVLVNKKYFCFPGRILRQSAHGAGLPGRGACGERVTDDQTLNRK
jgi:hypothetical protein